MCYISGAGVADPYGAPEFSPAFKWSSWSLVFCEPLFAPPTPFLFSIYGISYTLINGFLWTNNFLVYSYFSSLLLTHTKYSTCRIVGVTDKVIKICHDKLSSLKPKTPVCVVVNASHACSSNGRYIAHYLFKFILPLVLYNIEWTPWNCSNCKNAGIINLYLKKKLVYKKCI